MPKLNKLKVWLVGAIIALAACSGQIANLPPPADEVAGEQVSEIVAVEPAVIEETASAEATMPEEKMVDEEAEVAVEAETAGEAEEEVVVDEATVPVSGPSPEQSALLAQLKDWGQPPELTNEVWLNSEPLKLENLQGQVVVIEFWTFG